MPEKLSCVLVVKSDYRITLRIGFHSIEIDINTAWATASDTRTYQMSTA
jgi:hypothetical protein